MKTQALPGVSTGAHRRRKPWLYSTTGAMAGLVTAWCNHKLQLTTTNRFAAVIVTTAIFDMLGLTWFRIVAWAAGALMLLVALAVGYTPLMTVLLRQVVVQETLARVDAIMVLSSDIDSQGVPTPQGQRRLDHAYLLLKRRYASRLVLTRLLPPKPSSMAFVQRQLRERRLRFEVIEVGPIDNTHNEAVTTAAPARHHGWKRVIFVSDGSHLRRTKPLFARAGLNALGAPCPNPLYNINGPLTPRGRYFAFQHWWYETKLYYDHKNRGWV